MKLTFNGAAHEVTGSCHCLEAWDKLLYKKIIVWIVAWSRDI